MKRPAPVSDDLEYVDLDSGVAIGSAAAVAGGDQQSMPVVVGAAEQLEQGPQWCGAEPAVARPRQPDKLRRG